ncbi:MAG: helix-turn-helix transcriptional regulator [Kutzneria sp.]|nr:helix-turn-helix transcriptional regulator [Kutzneria sp.]
MATDHYPADNTEAAANVFAGELKRWRTLRGLSRTTLARRMGYDRSYVSKVESGAKPPSRDFAFHAEKALHSGGALYNAYREHTATADRSRHVDEQFARVAPQPPHYANAMIGGAPQAG